MATRVLCQPVFVLHHHAYRNSSLIVELFSQEHGRVAAVARSARGPKSRYRGCLQIFTPLLASWSGHRELMTLQQVELNGLAYPLTGLPLMCGFYLNELMLRLLPRDDPYPEIFVDYQQALSGLSQDSEPQKILRRFEKRLLNHLGYGLSFTQDAHSGTTISPQHFYQWLPDRGFLRCEQTNVAETLFSGSSLLALESEQWDNHEDLVAAKRLMRLVLARHLGSKPLKSRELLQ
jgi:DNA repair protein RecO (recombination protein O)